MLRPGKHQPKVSPSVVITLTPIQQQRQAQLLTGYGAIALRRVGDYAVVEIEITPGMWLEVIREPLDSDFSHIIEPLGIEEVMRRKGYDPEKGNWKTT